MPLLQPDKRFSHIARIDIRFDLQSRGLDKVLLDIDNTIRSRKDGQVPRAVQEWLARARSADIAFCLLSNNFHGDVRDLSSDLDIPLVAKAMKPLAPAYLAAMRRIDAKSAHTVVIGDQLITDILGAHILGLKAYLVEPLDEVDLPHTLFFRRVQRVLLGDQAGGTTPELGEAYHMEKDE